MKKISIAIRFLWVVVLSIAAASMALAAECLDRSPSYSIGKTPSDAISIRELTDTEYGQVKTLLNAMEGGWSGKGRGVICNLADIEDRTSDRYTIKAEGKLKRNGFFSLKMEFYSPQERTRHQKTLRLYLQDRHLRIHHNNGTGDVELIQISENRIELRYRTRIKTLKNRDGLYQEFFYRLSSGSGGFSIKRELYILGRLSGHDDWQFHGR